MSPVFHNSNDHAVSTRDEHGRTVRIGAHRASKVSGVAADTFADYADRGVSELTGKDAEQALAAKPVSADVTAEGRLPQDIADAQGRAGLSAVAPLHVVVGDDTAPLGPGSGTVESKYDVAARSDVDHAAFSPNEPRLDDAIEGVDPATGLEGPGAVSSAAIHNAQVEARQAADKAVKDAGLVGSVEQRQAAQGGSDKEQSKAELVKQAKARGLGVNGSKRELASRIAEHDAAQG